jgi:hypothetical protein
LGDALVFDCPDLRIVGVRGGPAGPPPPTDGRNNMSILVRFTPASAVTTQQYDETISRLKSDGGAFPPDGLQYHCAFIADGDLRVSEVWESQEKFEAFGPRLMPLLAEVGIDPGKPEILPVHNTITP